MSNLYINGHFLSQRVTGVQRYAIEVLNGFRRAGYPFEIIQPPSLFSSHKIGHILWEQFLLPQQKKGDAPLWSPTNTGPAFAANHVVTLHDIGIFPHPEWFSRSYVRWKKMLIPPMARHARGILTVSKFSKQVICKHLDVDAAKVKVVYNAVDTQRFKPASQSQINKIRKKYELQSPYVLALGSLDPRKNFSRLIEAWNHCIKKEQLTGYKLVIAGGSHASFNTVEADTSTDTIQFLGYVDDQDLPPLYSGAKGFLFPSLFEGFGLPVLEAMACGTPVITSNSTALDEIAGNAALKVTPRQTDSIKNGIMQLLESPGLQTSLVERGFKQIKEFDWDRSAAAIYRYLSP